MKSFVATGQDEIVYGMGHTPGLPASEDGWRRITVSCSQHAHFASNVEPLEHLLDRPADRSTQRRSRIPVLQGPGRTAKCLQVAIGSRIGENFKAHPSELFQASETSNKNIHLYI